MPVKIALVLVCFCVAVLPGELSPAFAEAKSAVAIGETVPADKLHIVTQPGRYGLGPEVPGSRYAIVGKLLVRIDAKTGAVQSIIREVDRILD